MSNLIQSTATLWGGFFVVTPCLAYFSLLDTILNLKGRNDTQAFQSYDLDSHNRMGRFISSLENGASVFS